MAAILWGVLVIVGIQAAVLYTIYRVYRRRAVNDSRSFQVFCTAYVTASVPMTVGPLAAALALRRFKPYSTPFGSVQPLAVTSAGTDAWVGGFALFLASFVGLWLHAHVNAR